MKLNLFRLRHHYSLLSGFYAVRTSMNLHEINLACAYIQLIRDELPDLKGVNDVISEDNGTLLLSGIYGLEVIRESEAVSDEVDFYTNWSRYCSAGFSVFREELLVLAKPCAFKKMIKNMINECHESMARLKAGSAEINDREHWIMTVQTNATRLKSVLNGARIDESWNWATLSGENCAGRIYVTEENIIDYPRCLLPN